MLIGTAVAVAEGVIAAVLLFLVILIRRAFRLASRGRHAAPVRAAARPDPELDGWQRKMVAELAGSAAAGELDQAARQVGLHLANRLRMHCPDLGDLEIARPLLIVVDQLEYSLNDVDPDPDNQVRAIGQVLASSVLELTALEHAPIVVGP